MKLLKINAPGKPSKFINYNTIVQCYTDQNLVVIELTNETYERLDFDNKEMADSVFNKLYNFMIDTDFTAVFEINL